MITRARLNLGPHYRALLYFAVILRATLQKNMCLNVVTAVYATINISIRAKSELAKRNGCVETAPILLYELRPIRSQRKSILASKYRGSR